MSLLHILFVTAALISSLVDSTDEPGKKYLAEKASEDGVVALPSGLLYKVINKGSGTFHPMENAPCLCHYARTLIDGTEFDSSYSRGEPTTFAPNQVIKGWTEAMQLMVEGDKWELYIPSELAYGERGSPPKIPGDSALVFTIEMLEIKGEKVIALKCNPSTLEDCNDRMKKYIAKTKTKGWDADEIDEELERLARMRGVSMAADLQAWMDTRIFILQQMRMATSVEGNDEL